MFIKQSKEAVEILIINISILSDSEKDTTDEKFLQAIQHSKDCMTYLQALCENNSSDELIDFIAKNWLKTSQFFCNLQKLDEYFNMTPPRQSPSLLRYSPIPFTKSWLSLNSSRSSSRNEMVSPVPDLIDQKKNISKLIRFWTNFYQILTNDTDVTELIQTYIAFIPKTYHRFLEVEEYAKTLSERGDALDAELSSRQSTPIYRPSPII